MRSTQLLRLTVAVVIAAVLSPPLATAQPPAEGRQRQRGQFGQRGERGQRGGRGDQFGQRDRGAASITSVGLLGIDKIREELKIDEGQAATIDAAIESYRGERREAQPDRAAFQNLSDEEREAMRTEMRVAQETLAARTDEVIAVLLKPEQNSRLRELVIQLKMKTDPIGTLKTDEMTKTLHLSADQVAQIDTIQLAMQKELDDMRQTMRESFSAESGQRPDFSQMRENMQELSQKFNKRTLEILTIDQSSQLMAMQGKVLEIDLQTIQGNRRGRGGFGGRGGRRDRGGAGGGNRRRQRPPAEDDAA
ncbi:MAG: hypothetical protein ABGZ35_19250 [Planctomycetaceae bacterium]